MSISAKICLTDMCYDAIIVMELRRIMFVRAKKRGNRTYLAIVRNERIDGKVKQTVLQWIGRLDILQQTGQLDRLLISAQRFSENLIVLGAHQRGEGLTTRTRRIGPALIFERLWKQLDMAGILGELLRGRKYEFSVERAIFLTVLHRLFASGSDRAAEEWKEGYAIEGVDQLSLHHLYRAMAWIGEVLPQTDQPATAGSSALAPRCNKDNIEEALFGRRRDLFTSLEVVFFDTTSIYFEGEGGCIGENGRSKDHRGDLKQMVVGVVLDDDGYPICSEIYPGNTTDVTTLIPIVERLRVRFGIGNICVVADRGMISQENKTELEARGWKYILGVRMRNLKEAKLNVLSRGGRYREVHPSPKGRNAASPLKVKEVWVEDRRYIVCQNEDQARRDRAHREAIVQSLADALKKGDKSLIGNRGYRRYVKTPEERFTIDTDKIKEEERYDGKWVLSTNTELSAAETALKYKQLWMVEDIFRSMKSLLRTRPIYHKCDETIRGHVFCSFLALLLRKELQDRLDRSRFRRALSSRGLPNDSKGWRLSWSDVIRDLDNLIEMEVTLDRKGYIIRSETKGTVGKTAQACGVALPPTIRKS
jgi:transposase